MVSRIKKKGWRVESWIKKKGWWVENWIKKKDDERKVE